MSNLTSTAWPINEGHAKRLYSLTKLEGKDIILYWHVTGPEPGAGWDNLTSMFNFEAENTITALGWINPDESYHERIFVISKQGQLWMYQLDSDNKPDYNSFGPVGSLLTALTSPLHLTAVQLSYPSSSPCYTVYCHDHYDAKKPFDNHVYEMTFYEGSWRPWTKALPQT